MNLFPNLLDTALANGEHKHAVHNSRCRPQIQGSSHYCMRRSGKYSAMIAALKRNESKPNCSAPSRGRSQNKVTEEYTDFAIDATLMTTEDGQPQVSRNDSQEWDTFLHQVSKDASTFPAKKKRRGPRGGVAMPFPMKLHQLLENDDHMDVISWQPHGRCFLLRDPKVFLQEVMPRYFKQSKLTSFQRQLNLYGFRRLTSPGPDKGGYYHERFLRGRPSLCEGMLRIRIKGTGTKSASNPESEPNFYSMSPVQSYRPSNVMIPDQTVINSMNSTDHVKNFPSPVCVSTPNSKVFSAPPFPRLDLPDQAQPDKVASLSTNFSHSSAFHTYQDSSVSPKVESDALTFEGREFHYICSDSLESNNNDHKTEVPPKEEVVPDGSQALEDGSDTCDPLFEIDWSNSGVENNFDILF